MLLLLLLLLRDRAITAMLSNKLDVVSFDSFFSGGGLVANATAVEDDS
jgi:hypothetical protein